MRYVLQVYVLFNLEYVYILLSSLNEVNCVFTSLVRLSNIY